MGSKDKLPKIADADREAQYGYVFGVSGPGMKIEFFLLMKKFELFSSRYC
jgi:hypothetical protein